MRIAAIGAGAPPVRPAAPPVDEHRAAVGKAARELEEVFLRQILTAAHLGGKAEGGGEYQSMMVDAVAGAVEKGGGMGLAAAIEDAVRTAERAASSSPRKDRSSG